MFSSQPSSESIHIRQDDGSAGPADERPGRCGPGERGRPGLASRRRLAIVTAVAVGVASGSAAIVTVTATAGGSVAHRSGTATAGRALRLAERHASFERRIHALEARGYSDVACVIGGDRFFNARTHRSVVLKA